MPSRRTRITPQSAHGRLAAALTALGEEFGVPEGFPAAALAEARSAAPPEPAIDLRDLPFVTLDPVGSRDLDQAFHLERTARAATRAAARGFTLHYAIADVPGFVAPGGALDAEARTRGQTLYLPDGAVPLHPPVLSEGRASLLPDADRSAYVWTVALDSDGSVVDARVERALIRSRAQLDYPSAQAAIDLGAAAGPLALLPEVGRLRIAQEHARGGASLNLPEEEILRDEHGYRIERRTPLPVEEWNAQLSLLTGMIAGRMMLDARIGILRTMPPPAPEALDGFRARVAALGTPWP
ncbi:RNB domain-containing ribonuclease, partial [Leucobacter soli]|uniref:RNB domain-containing ribonuclease n=1 Tax=Leucobacter soli TaxID=2812850 RepID=UPI003614B437